MRGVGKSKELKILQNSITEELYETETLKLQKSSTYTTDDIMYIDDTLGYQPFDADCDAVLNENGGGDDCNDTDSSYGSQANDADCDGVETADDCDDGNMIYGAKADDADCDLVLNSSAGGDDCDDGLKN